MFHLITSILEINGVNKVDFPWRLFYYSTIKISEGCNQKGYRAQNTLGTLERGLSACKSKFDRITGII